MHLIFILSSEVYADLPEKRRKRGSLFFRKKKDKSKTKGQSTNCDGKLFFIIYLLYNGKTNILYCLSYVFTK